MTDLATLLVGFGLFGTFILIPQIAVLPGGGDVGLNATEAGLLMAPGGLMMLIAAPVVGRVSERIGARLPLAVGGQVAASIVAAHVVTGGMPANQGIELAFPMSAGVALPAGLAGLLFPQMASGRTAARPLALAER